MRFAVCLLASLAVLGPATASASCDVVDHAPLVFADRRPCLTPDEGVFFRSAGMPWAAHFAHGYSCLGERQYRLAASEFATAHSENPRDVRPVMYEAVARDLLGEPAQVARLVALARRLAPRADPPMRSDPLPGATQLLNGQYAQAFAHWRGLADQPYNRPIYEDAHAVEPYRKGLDLAVRGDYCGALRILAPTVAGTAEFGDIRFVMGSVYYALGNHAQARYEWDAAAIETPPQPGFWVAGPIQWTALNLLVHMPH